MSDFLISFLAFGIIFAGVDSVWLVSSSKLYKRELGSLMLEKPNFIAAVIFYVIYVFGVTYLALLPSLDEKEAMLAVMNAGVLGFVAYATYDLTNLATLKKWSQKIVVLDIIWGTFATTVSAGLTYLLVTNAFGL